MEYDNAREELEAAAAWLGYQHEDLSYGLKSPEDGIKLWREWRSDPDLPEFCDEAENADEGVAMLGRVVAILGYDPWSRYAEAMLAGDQS